MSQLTFNEAQERFLVKPGKNYRARLKKVEEVPHKTKDGVYNINLHVSIMDPRSSDPEKVIGTVFDLVTDPEVSPNAMWRTGLYNTALNMGIDPAVDKVTYDLILAGFEQALLDGVVFDVDIVTERSAMYAPKSKISAIRNINQPMKVARVDTGSDDDGAEDQD